MKRLYRYVLLLICFGLISISAAAAPVGSVYVIPIADTIDPGLAAFVERSYEEAEAAKASRVILEIDTYGGRIDAAIRINERIMASPLPTVSFVSKKAVSAGALIALSGEKIAMAPGTTMGAAEPRIGNEKADEKVVSLWANKLAGAAEAHGRDDRVAAAMADADIEIPGLVEKGKLLTLTPKQALEWNFTDFIASNRQEVLREMGMAEARVVEMKPTGAETLSRWVTNPYISPILLAVGIAGIVLEVFTAGWGVAGTLGVISFGLFFGGHMIAGLTGWESVLLFILGIILLLVEAFFIPGFGVAGIGGMVALVVSIIMASPSLEQAIISLIFALIGSVALLALSFKFVKTRRVWKGLILGTRQEKGEGYVAPEAGLNRLLGEEGITLTPLRPAGAVEIDGSRVDVVTNGEFIARDTRVEVIKVEGSRVIVKEIRKS